MYFFIGRQFDGNVQLSFEAEEEEAKHLCDVYHFGNYVPVEALPEVIEGMQWQCAESRLMGGLFPIAINQHFAVSCFEAEAIITVLENKENWKAGFICEIKKQSEES